MDLPKVLIQLDSDLQPSSFDAIVALDAGVDHLLSYREVDELSILELIHGAMFTRGPKQLQRTAIFIGGSDVALGERLLKKVVETFFGPLRVSVMLDSNGSNTTAAAAVLSALPHRQLSADVNVSVLGGTGAVGRRIAQLCALQGAAVQMVSRDQDRARKVIGHLSEDVSKRIRAVEAQTPEQLESVLAQTDVLFSAGAAGVEMLSEAIVQNLTGVSVIVDVNAIPPFGIGGVKVDDQGAVRCGKTFYGAFGVGGLKMKIHRRAIQSLFETNKAVLDACQIFSIGELISATEKEAAFTKMAKLPPTP